MLKDAFSYLVSLGKSSSEIHTKRLPGSRLMVVSRSGETIVDLDRRTRSDAVTTLADLCDWSGFLHDDDMDRECFVSEERVLLTLNREDETSDLAILNLVKSVEWDAMCDLISEPLTQREVIRLFRGPLARAIKPHHLAAFKSVTFRSASSRDQGASTLGRSIEASVTSNGGELPTEIELRLSVFNPAIAALELQSIQLAVEVHYDQERFEFMPIGDSQSQAVNDALASIRAQLRERLGDKTLVIAGTQRTEKSTVGV